MMGWFKDFWSQERAFTLAFAGEVFRVFLILLGLLAIFEFLKYMGVQGYDPVLLKILEKADFVIALAAITRGGWMFIGMLDAKNKEHGR